VALGFTHEVVERAGANGVTIPGVTAVEGGLLVNPGNAGRDVRARFAVLPETTVQLGYWITEHLNAFVGYNFLYVSSVARPGDQIDPVIGAVRPGATAHPVGGITGTDFYANSVTLGLGYNW
jgi:hypothetical protein